MQQPTTSRERLGEALITDIESRVGQPNLPRVAFLAAFEEQGFITVDEEGVVLGVNRHLDWL